MTASLITKNLSFTYQEDGPLIIDKLNFELQPASFNLLTGPSGCGKSTFFKLLAGLYPQYGGKLLSGQVLLNNQAIAAIVPYERSRYVGMLFQEPSRQFALPTVAKQITFALENIQTPRDQIEPKLNQVLTKLNLTALKDRPLFQLSGGEQQRLALATTLALDSQIILLDEPFANVDPLGKQTLLADLKKLQLEAGKTIFITDHDTNGYYGLVDNLYRFSKSELTPLPLSSLTERQEQPLTYTPLNSGQLTWQDVTVTVQNRQLFKTDSFTLPQGQLGLLSGPNGVGKSSFFKALTKQLAFNGSIAYRKRDSRRYKAKSWAKIVALVFQDSDNQFVRLTVREELALSKKHSLAKGYWTDAKITQALEVLDLTAYLDHSCYQLSGGQKRKLQVLSMLIMAQPVLLLDEPLASLDTSSADKLLTLITETCQKLKLSILLISHQRSCLPGYVTYELVLNQGRLALRRDFDA